MIPTSTRVQYANGYLELGMLDAASDEIEAVEGEDRLSVEVLLFRSRLYNAAEQWELMEAVSKQVANTAPANPQGWIQWGNALRFQGRFEDARQVALKALKRHPEESHIWYNLACFLCLMGDLEESGSVLKKALKMNPKLREAALDDPDLEAVWNESFC